MPDKTLVYTAQSKQYFYCRDAVCEYVFRYGDCIPINPFRVFDYFLGDRVARDAIRAANQEVLSRCDEVWVFGEQLADGVLMEIAQAKTEDKTIRYFTISNQANEIREIEDLGTLTLERDVPEVAGLNESELLDQMRQGRFSDLANILGRPLRVTA